MIFGRWEVHVLNTSVGEPWWRVVNRYYSRERAVKRAGDLGGWVVDAHRRG